MLCTVTIKLKWKTNFTVSLKNMNINIFCCNMESNYVYAVKIIGIIQIKCTDHEPSDCVTSILNLKTVDHLK